MRGSSAFLRNRLERPVLPVKPASSESYAPCILATVFTPPVRRIRSLEAHVADIRQSQTIIQNTLMDIAAHLRGSAPLSSRSPYPGPFAHHSPGAQSLGSPAVSTPSTGTCN